MLSREGGKSENVDCNTLYQGEVAVHKISLITSFFSLKYMYQTGRGSSHMCVRGIHFTTYEFLLFDVWYCCDSVVFFVFHFINYFSTWCIGRVMYCLTLSTSSSFICGNQNIRLQSTFLTTPFESLFTWCISLKYCSPNVKQQSIICFLSVLLLYFILIVPLLEIRYTLCTLCLWYVYSQNVLYLSDFWIMTYWFIMIGL
jgi:hypothetical protein